MKSLRGRDVSRFQTGTQTPLIAGRSIRACYEGDRIHTFTDEQVGELRLDVKARLVDTPGSEGASYVRSRVIETLTGEQPRAAIPVDPRLERAIAVMYEHRAEYLSVSQLADLVAMSESSLSHLFREHIGVPVSRYRTWLRTLEATRILPECATTSCSSGRSGPPKVVPEIFPSDHARPPM